MHKDAVIHRLLAHLDEAEGERRRLQLGHTLGVDRLLGIQEGRVRGLEAMFAEEVRSAAVMPVVRRGGRLV